MRNVNINVDHRAAHAMIAALSIAPEGRALVKGLEDIRYYHGAGYAADLGHGAVYAVAIDEDDPDHDMGSILLPGKQDRLWYRAAAWRGDTIPAALYWGPNATGPTLIPRILGEWAAECVVNRSGFDPLTPAECKGAAYSVDAMPGMVVTMPYDLQLPGLTRDKWARRRAHQDHYRADDRHSWYAKGYHDYCVVVYDVDACADVQCARHLVAGDYEPRDLTELDVLPEWERELLDGEATAGVA